MRFFRFLGFAAMALLAVSCGVGGGKPAGPSTVTLPTQAEADSIAAALGTAARTSDGTGQTVTIPYTKPAGPRVYTFTPSADSNYIKVIALMPKKNAAGWEIESSVDYPAFDMIGDLRFKAFNDSVLVREFGGAKFLTFGVLREGAVESASTQVLYNLDTDGLQSVTFSGKRLKDGRIEGTSNKTMLVGTERPEMQWAIARQAADPNLVELSRADLMSDQAIGWWLDNNPDAATRASKIAFGALPEESSLVASFKSAKKENSAKYRAALLNTRGYTVVVAYRKSSGAYYIAWAEPQCTDRKRGKLLNSIYFENDTSLVLFYYRGKTTFKYRVNLANAKITR